MTSPVEQIRVACPRCGREYDDWMRGSVNLNLDDFDDDYVRACSTATCPECDFVVELNTLVVEGNVWTFSPPSLRAAAEAEMVAALRERFGDDHPLLTPGLFRGSLWFQSASWALN
jgi:hypothetical protein